ncbi:hypothetical protein [Persephonella sp. KM09-Lau-8]|uniref:hypothetical protein n=1 Tax=Persephonella sp. KM09-Lau-8 TaxID=1158345 RepID=UPI000498386E|nr:hypothetical protein [Persephonella sp. KM09-Lau-8]
MEVNIFLSSKTEEENVQKIRKLVNIINEKHIDVFKNYGIKSLKLNFIEPNNNIFGQNIREEICKSIDKSNIFIFIYTRENPEWIMFELGYAYSKKVKLLLISKYNKISGPYENINRLNPNNLNLNTFKREILRILKDTHTIRDIITNNFKENIMRYFPLDKSLRCKISGTSLNIEPYFLENFNYSFQQEGLRFNGNFYLKQFLGNTALPDEFSVLLWFKFKEENFKNRFCDIDSRRDEPIFLCTIGNLERKENSHIGLYYGRPAIENSEHLPVGLRIFTYCKEQSVNNCDSEKNIDIDNNKWYLGILSYSAGNPIKFYLYDKDSFRGEISTDYNVSINNPKNYLTIGGGFPLLKIYAGLDENFKILLSESKEKLENSVYFSNSSLQLKKSRNRCESAGGKLKKEEIDLKPYSLNFIDDFRFLGFIREFIIFNRVLNETERENLWKLMRNILS